MDNNTTIDMTPEVETNVSTEVTTANNLLNVVVLVGAGAELVELTIKGVKKLRCWLETKKANKAEAEENIEEVEE